MKVILFGASGMVGQGVLLECLKDPQVSLVLCVGRSPLDRTTVTKAGLADKAYKIWEVTVKDFSDYSSVQNQFFGYDACFFCLGVSSAGMSEDDYRHITYDYTLAAGKLLSRLDPDMTFTYVSGVGTDSTEKGRMMWARVKGATENALLELPFKAAYMYRPGAIVPMDGISPRNQWLKRLLVVFGPLFAIVKKLLPGALVTTREIGRSMIQVAGKGYDKKWLEPRDIIRSAKD